MVPMSPRVQRPHRLGAQAREASLQAAGKLRGFTLIELMIVVAVIAILAAIAIPSYADSVRKGRRGQVKVDLVESAQLLERYRTINATYLGMDAYRKRSPETGTKYYDIAASGQTATAFVLKATPVAATDQVKDACGVLAISAVGTKTHSKGTDAECQFGTTGTQ